MEKINAMAFFLLYLKMKQPQGVSVLIANTDTNTGAQI